MSALLMVACWTLLLQPSDVARTIDGDTAEFRTVEVWPGVAALRERIRILGVDTPERGQPGYVEAGTFTAQWFARGPFRLESCKRDAFGRLLATVWREGDTLAVALIGAGHGVPR